MPDLKFVALSILFSVAVVGSPAAGQTIPSPYTFIEHSQEWAVFAGKSFISPGSLGLGPRDAITFGGRYSIAFTGAMSVDISGTLFKSKRDVRDVSLPEDDRVLGRSDIDIGLFDVKLRLNLTGGRAWHNLQPFIMFGAGIAFPFATDRRIEQTTFLPGDEWYSFGTRFAGTFGGGVNYHLSRKISLRLETVVSLWKITTPVGWLTLENDPLREFPLGEWVSSTSILLGASWRF